MCMAPSTPSPPPAPAMPTPPPPPPTPPPPPVAVGEKMSTIKTAASMRDSIRKRAAGVANFKIPGQIPTSRQPLSAESIPNLGTIRSRAIGLNIPGS